MSKLTKTFFKTNPEGVWLSARIEESVHTYKGIEGLLFIPKGLIDELDVAIRQVADPFKLNDMNVSHRSTTFNFEVHLPIHVTWHMYGEVIGSNISLSYSERHQDPSITVNAECTYEKYDNKVLNFSILRKWEDIDIEDEFPDMEE
mgnify:CR=1 FL=1